MQKRTVILILFFVSLFHNVYCQTDVDAVKSTLQNMAKAWTTFPKNQDKETILKFYDKNYTESGYTTTVVNDKDDYRYEEFGDGQYAALDNELQEISDKITLGNNIGILFKLGEIKKIEVSGNLAFVFVDFLRTTEN